MRTLSIITALLIVLVGIVSGSASDAAAMTVTGTVVSKTSDTVVISTSTGQETFAVSSLSLYPSDVVVGSRVSVTYEPNSVGSGNRATRIMLAADTSRSSTYDDDAMTDTRYGERSSLPDTAGPVPTYMTVGLVVLSAGLITRALRRPW